MTNHNSANERIKRQYFAYLAEALGRSEQSIDAVAKAIAHAAHRARRQKDRLSYGTYQKTNCIIEYCCITSLLCPALLHGLLNVCFRGFRFLIDGEAIVTNGDGLAVFDLIRHKRYGDAAVLCAFDLIELDGEDLRRSPIEYRKCKLAKLVRGPHLGIVVNEHYEGDGEIVLPSSTRAR